MVFMKITFFAPKADLSEFQRFHLFSQCLNL